MDLLGHWPMDQKEEFLRQQFQAQHEHYQHHFPEATYQIIIYKNQDIGRLYLDTREDEIRIIDIAIIPSFRGKGIGREILGEILKTARKKDFAVRIHVEKDNPAMTLYKRLGFSLKEDKGVYHFMEWSAKDSELINQ